METKRRSTTKRGTCGALEKGEERLNRLIIKTNWESVSNVDPFETTDNVKQNLPSRKKSKRNQIRYKKKNWTKRDLLCLFVEKNLYVLPSQMEKFNAPKSGRERKLPREMEGGKIQKKTWKRGMARSRKGKPIESEEKKKERGKGKRVSAQFTQHQNRSRNAGEQFGSKLEESKSKPKEETMKFWVGGAKDIGFSAGTWTGKNDTEVEY